MSPHDDDDMFMAHFTERLNLEPPPAWAHAKPKMPWLEIGWAAAAALLLGLYWTELQFGFFTLKYALVQKLPVVSEPLMYTAVAAVIGLSILAMPWIKRELV